MDLVFNSPLGLAKADQIIDDLPLARDERVLEVGCGTGEFLIRLVERKGGHGLGVDQDGASIAAARKAAVGRVPAGSIEFRAAPIQDVALDDATFELAVCIGSTHAYGRGEAAYPNSLRELGRVVRPGGCVLVGETYWKCEPAPEYLELLGDPAGIYRDHAGNVALAAAQGLVPLGARVSSDDEWDQFEWSHQRRIERDYAASPENPDLARKVHGRRAWMQGYLRWGRATMGFGFYLFQKPRPRISPPPPSAQPTDAP